MCSLDRDSLAATALRVFRAGLAAVEPRAAVARCLEAGPEALVVRGLDGATRVFEWSRYRRVLVLGAGKASARMAAAVEEAIGERVVGGLLSVKAGHGVALARIRQLEAGHPIPDEAGRTAAEELVRMVDGAGEETLVVVLVSGGGSALLPLPAPGITLGDKQRTTELLLAAGADIREVNAVRKHLSAVKGGQLARRALPATVVALVLSDVVGDPLDVIASGPTVPDESTFAEAADVLRRYRIESAAPPAVLARLEAGCRGELPETPKPRDPAFDRTSTLLVGTNAAALEACRQAADAEGFRPLLLSSSVEGEASAIGRLLGSVAREVRSSGNPLPAPACVLAGGETTVTVRGPGKGGRNQELALAAALAIDGLERVVLLSAGTDGTDGPTDAAGAFAHGDTVARARRAGLDPRRQLADNDSYGFFNELGDLLRTGPTGTNVMDVQVLLIR